MMENYIQLTDDENRKIQLEILDELDNYCKIKGLTYFIIAGTLLGAVRHHGYIPWDDDIDVVMPRDDYEKLVETYNDNEFYLCSIKSNKAYDLPYAKLCKNHTRIIENISTKYEIGINIDIFPIDSVPNDISKRCRMFKKIAKYKFVLEMKRTVPSEKRSTIKNLLLRFLHLLFRPVSNDYLISKMNDISKMYNRVSSDLCAEVVWGCGEREVVNRAVFSNSVNLDFENKIYKAPIGWDEWLSKRYGNYMKLPPLDARSTHHSFKAFKEK